MKILIGLVLGAVLMVAIAGVVEHGARDDTEADVSS